MSHPATAVPVVYNVRITNAAVDTCLIQGRMTTVIRGSLSPEFFEAVMVPVYQRMAMKNHKHDGLVEALAPGGIGVPDDLLLCNPTDEYIPQGSGEFLIRTTGMNLLDGHQRMTAAWARLALGQPTQPFGVKIFLGTTVKEETAAFYQVNRMQTKVSTDVLLRNSGTNAAIEALRKLVETDSEFPRVRWDQLKRTGELITARMLYEVAVVLHGHAKNKAIEDLLADLEETTDRIGTELLVENVRTFFRVVREAFGKESLERYMYRADLLCGLAALFAEFQDFWDNRNPEKLLVRANDVKKLGTIKRHTVEKDLNTNTAHKAVHHTLRIHFEKGRKVGLTLREQA